MTWRARLRLGAAVGAALLLALGFLWLRDSSLVSVKHVKITGLHGKDSPQIAHALRAAAGDMTTLHIREDQLRGAVAAYPIVKDIRVSRDVPHGLRIRVIQYDPVAAVVSNGRRVAVAADGTVLTDTTASAALPTMSVPAASAGSRLADPHALRAVSLMGVAPRALRPLVQDVRNGPGGLEVQLRSGPLLEFGSASDLQAKWDAATRILADPHAAGASYLDLRIPSRPVAGRFPGDATSSGGTDSTGSDSGGTASTDSSTDSTTADSSGSASDTASGDTGGTG